MFESKKVTWFPSYGAEMRGGTANCTVIISNTMIGSPVVFTPDILVVMNMASLDKFQPQLRNKGLLFYDSSLIRKPVLRKDVRAVPVPATEIAGSAGNTKGANMVMLGALIAKTALLKKSSIAGVFGDPAGTIGKTVSKLNADAIREGMRYIETT